MIFNQIKKMYSQSHYLEMFKQLEVSLLQISNWEIILFKILFFQVAAYLETNNQQEGLYSKLRQQQEVVHFLAILLLYLIVQEVASLNKMRKMRKMKKGMIMLAREMEVLLHIIHLPVLMLVLLDLNLKLNLDLQRKVLILSYTM